MEQWEVNFLRCHFNKYVVFKIKNKMSPPEAQRMCQSLPSFVLDAVQTSRPELCLLSANNQTEMKHAHLHPSTHTHRKKTDARGR